MDTTITLNLSESEYKALTVVCKALKTTPEQVVRASAKKLFENPMDFMFEAFTSENMGFQVSEGQPTSLSKPTPAKVAETVQKKTEKPVKVEKPAAPKPEIKPPTRLPSMGVAQFKEHHDEIITYIGEHPCSLVKDMLCQILDVGAYDYVGSDKTFRYYLEGLRDKGEIVIENKDGVRCRLPSYNPAPKTPTNPLTGDMILKANGKYRKRFYEAIAKTDSKVMTDADFVALFDNEGYDADSILPAIDEAFQSLATKGLVHFSGKKGSNITIPEKFRYKIWKVYPELKAKFSTN